jgi:hypothetical protein
MNFFNEYDEDEVGGVGDGKINFSQFKEAMQALKADRLISDDNIQDCFEFIKSAQK